MFNHTRTFTSHNFLLQLTDHGGNIKKKDSKRQKKAKPYSEKKEAFSTNGTGLTGGLQV